MRADDLHADGTYAELVLDDASREKLNALADRLGITNKIDPAEMHTTVIYSRKPCPGAMSLHGTATPYRGVVKGLKTWPTQKGTNCLVAEIDATAIDQLHQHMRDQYGATHDYPEFTPHVTLSYDCGDQELTLPPGEHTVGYTTLHVKPLEPKWSA
jgi:hypothetical protein